MNERIRVALLSAAVIVVYANSLLNGFAYDDDLYILHNPAVTHSSVRGLLQVHLPSNVFRPVTFSTFALNWVAGGGQPFGFHLVNLILQVGVVLLLYALLKTLLEAVPRGTTIAFAAALLFAVHPIHTEAVAYIEGRSELLAAGFLLAAWLMHLHDRPMAATGFLLLAMMSKESAVVFVPLVLAGDYARGRLKPPFRYAWIAAFAVGYLALFWRIEGGRFGERSVLFLDNPLASLPASLRVPNALRVAWKYVALQLYPTKLSYDYSYNAILLYSTWRYLWPALFATLLVLGLWICALWTRRGPWFLAGAIYLLGFGATANVLLPTGTIMGERLAYLPSAGFCLLVALTWAEVLKRKRLIGWAILAILVVALGARTVVRNRDWSDNFTLFLAAVRAVPGSARAHMNLGAEYGYRGQLDAAVREFQTAIRIYPNFPQALLDYGLVEARMGHHQEALRILEKALSVAERDSTRFYFIEVNLASELMKVGRGDDALAVLNHEIEELPTFAPAWSNRAVLRSERGESAAAQADAEMALRLDPSDTQAQEVLRQLKASTPQR